MSAVQNIPSGGATGRCNLISIPEGGSISERTFLILHSLSLKARSSLHHLFLEDLQLPVQDSIFLVGHCSQGLVRGRLS